MPVAPIHTSLILENVAVSPRRGDAEDGPGVTIMLTVAGGQQSFITTIPAADAERIGRNIVENAEAARSPISDAP